MYKGISIIITCCDNYEYTKESIDSILNLHVNNNYEIIIVDDSHNIKDGFFDDYVDLYKIIIINNNGNKGVQYSRNKGLENAKYKYILMIDGDDKLNLDKNVIKDGNYLDLSIELLEKNKDIVFTHCILEMFDGFNGYTISSYNVTEELLVKKHHVPICIVYRKSDAINCGGYDIEIKKWQDWSFAISIMNYRFKNSLKNITYFYNKPFYLYRIHNANKQISNKQIDELEMIDITIRKNREIFEKYFGNNTINLAKMCKIVLSYKPDRMEELMYVARDNIAIAKEIVNQRKYTIVSALDINNIP